MVKDSLGDRMKKYYEEIPKTKLMRRTPVIIRIDGKAFHSFTRGFEKPFDEVLIAAMQKTTKHLCENIQGCVFGYTQSDEISLILIDYQKLETSAWFDYEVQKMCSVAASMATAAFNFYFKVETGRFLLKCRIDGNGNFADKEKEKLHEIYSKASTSIVSGSIGATFDARCFNIPREEVTNYIYWRQLDATRNSIQMVGQVNFSHNKLQNKSCNDIQDMLMTQKGINWNDFAAYLKRGTAVFKNGIIVNRNNKMEEIMLFNPEHSSREWIIDYEMPQLKDENREYIERLIKIWW